MKKINYSILLSVLILSLLITACTPDVAEVPTIENTVTSTVATPMPEKTEIPEVQTRFTIQSDPELIDPVTVLYEAFF